MGLTDKVRDKMVDLSDRLDEVQRKREQKKAEEEGEQGQEQEGDEGEGQEEQGGS